MYAVVCNGMQGMQRQYKHHTCVLAHMWHHILIGAHYHGYLQHSTVRNNLLCASKHRSLNLHLKEYDNCSTVKTAKK